MMECAQHTVFPPGSQQYRSGPGSRMIFKQFHPNLLALHLPRVYIAAIVGIHVSPFDRERFVRTTGKHREHGADLIYSLQLEETG
jgi:hypothetical protein